MKLEDSGADQLSLAMKQLTVSERSLLWSQPLGYAITSNRIGSLKLKENACKGLAFARPFIIYRKGYNTMDLLMQAAHAWKTILEYRYTFIYGYKQKLYPINLNFSPEDFPHLAGFQYMKDISIPNYSSAKIVDRIIEGKIKFKNVQSAARYEEMIEPRLQALIHLKNSLDNEFKLFSFTPRMYPFITNIKADYLISSHIEIDNFIFIIQSSPAGKSKCDFLCCSTFEKGTRDYETNQRSRTLLKKERLHIPSNETTILFNKLTCTSSETTSQDSSKRAVTESS